MRVRALHQDDIKELMQIHKEHYPGNIFPDFTTHTLAAFVIESDDGEIITAGGIKNVAKAELITNKSLGAKERSKALLEANRYANLVCLTSAHPSLYAIVNNDDTYVRALEHNGFQKLKDIVLVKDF